MSVKQQTKKIATECLSWRWNGNLGDDMSWAAQESMFKSSLELGQYISSPKAVLVGGGTLIPKAPENPDLLDLSRCLPTVIFGTGVGDPFFWGKDHIPEWIEILKNSQFIGVRGPLSKDRLEEWGLSSQQIKVIGDTCLYFTEENLKSHHVQGEIAVNLGVTYGQLYGKEEELENIIIQVLNRLVKDGWNITLVCAWEPDDVVMDRIKAKVQVKGIEHWHDDYSRALQSIKKFDVVLCEKLHIGVTAACQGIPFVPLNYRSKVMDFCRSIDWEEFCVTTKNPDPDQILEKINSLVRVRKYYSNRLHQSVLSMRDLLLEAVPLVVDLMNENDS